MKVALDLLLGVLELCGSRPILHDGTHTSNPLARTSLPVGAWAAVAFIAVTVRTLLLADAATAQTSERPAYKTGRRQRQ